jgi:RNA polymerase sigma factor (sigma-70 family)
VLDPGSAGAARALGEGDPLPPEDQLTSDELKAELERLYRTNAGSLANRLAPSGASDGLDLVHEAFARLLSLSRGKLTAIARPAAYVAKISKNLEHDRGRACIQHNAWVGDSAAGSRGHHDPIVYLESRDTLRRLEAGVMKLKPVTRTIFLARRVEGLSYSEISKITGLSHKAIEKHMGRAIAKLSRLMDRS